MMELCRTCPYFQWDCGSCDSDSHCDRRLELEIDKGYQKGRANAIEEFKGFLKEYTSTNIFGEKFVFIQAKDYKKLKEQNKCEK